jgi:COP9 signalosome complex subunit 6
MSEFVTHKADASTFILHPLVLINISDHFTRQKVQTKTANPRVIGALLGQQRAKTVEMFNSFELIYELSADGVPILDVDFLRERKAQCISFSHNLSSCATPCVTLGLF